MAQFMIVTPVRAEEPVTLAIDAIHHFMRLRPPSKRSVIYLKRATSMHTGSVTHEDRWEVLESIEDLNRKLIEAGAL